MTSDLIPELFQVCRASVNRLVGGFGRPAWLEPTPHGAGKPRKLSSGGEKPLPAVPKLTPGNILVLDLGAHNREGALRRIAAGARARPPAVRSGVLLVEGVGIPEELRSTPRGDLGRYHGAPIELVTAADARGWFAHHAYSIQPK